ncbi:MAG: hypothetical protein JWN46_2423 [Acidimicrobiales bacterium]|nr:hypothetical protein [Acidimicrobiales bacterium]
MAALTAVIAAVSVVSVTAQVVGTAAPVASPASRRATALATDGIRRVLFVGDSLTFFGQPQLTAEMQAHGVAVAFAGAPGTGLLSGQDHWLTAIAAQVRSFRPDVVVIEACCNYAYLEAGYTAADGSVVAPDSPAMYAEWTRAARTAVREASAGGASVYWVVTPDAGPQIGRNFRIRIQRFNAISAALGVPLIDWRATVEPGGVYTRSIGGAQVRRADDLHLTDTGSQLVASVTWQAIAARFPGAA